VANALVQIVGLRELRLDLARLDKEYFTKAFVAAGVKVAEPLARRIRSALPSITGDLSGTVRVGKVRTGARIRVGTASVPYAGPVEFGGHPEGRPYLAGGRYVFPTAQGQAATAAKAYTEEVQAAIDHYPWSKPNAANG
jgi:hypothetical protein